MKLEPMDDFLTIQLSREKAIFDSANLLSSLAKKMINGTKEQVIDELAKALILLSQLRNVLGEEAVDARILANWSDAHEL